MQRTDETELNLLTTNTQEEIKTDIENQSTRYGETSSNPFENNHMKYCLLGLKTAGRLLQLSGAYIIGEFGEKLSHEESEARYSISMGSLLVFAGFAMETVTNIDWAERWSQNNSEANNSDSWAQRVHLQQTEHVLRQHFHVV